MSDSSILLAIRIGESSTASARTARWLATELGARVTVLYVAVELESSGTIAASAGLDESEIRERMRAEATARAGDFVREHLAGVPSEIVIGEGNVAEEVTAVAERIGARLIVTGQQGRGGVSAAILGDSTRDILRRATIPVVVAPPEGTS